MIAWIPILIGMESCSDMDDYLKFTDGGSKQYTGIVDSVKFLSGYERVVFSGLLTSDPKIDKVKVFWNMRKDSLVLDVERTTGVDTIYESIPLPEGRYSFEVVSYDKKGISSITVSKQGVSYGSIYQRDLYNRAIKSFEKEGDDAIIEWYNGDENSPFTEIRYIDNKDKECIVRVPIKEEMTILSNYKGASIAQFQTYFLPDTSAVDTFKTVIEEKVAIEKIRNSGNPFLRSDGGTGKWGRIADWQYTSNILNQEGNTLGGWSTDAGGCIHLESQDWGGPGFENGKIYQTISLPSGNYSLEYYSDGFGGNATSLFVVTLGGNLPDIENADDNSLAYELSENDGVRGSHKIDFRLEEPANVTLGWVVTIHTSNTWYHINWIKLAFQDQ